jgi:hypothetical protein
MPKMAGTTAQLPVKKRGNRYLFSEAVEDAIAKAYYHDGKTAEELAEAYGGLSRTGKASASAIRLAAKRGEERTLAREGQC